MDIMAEIHKQKPQSRSGRMQAAISARRANSAKRLIARKSIIEDGIEQGLTYADIGRLIARAEDRSPPLSAAAVHQYMKQNGIKGVGKGARRGGRRAATRDISQICEMMREHFTADQIALVLGVSKSSVFGHWFRNRNAG